MTLRTGGTAPLAVGRDANPLRATLGTGWPSLPKTKKMLTSPLSSQEGPTTQSNHLPEKDLLQSPPKQNKGEEQKRDHPSPHRALPASSPLTAIQKRDLWFLFIMA